VVLDADDISDLGTTNKFVTAAEKATWDAKQNAIGYTPENQAYKDQVSLVNSVDHYPSSSLLNTLLGQKQNTIGYTPENVSIYKLLFMPDGDVVGIPQVGVPIQGPNPLAPQFGMPWQLVKNYAPNESLKISFLPNKIDIIQEKEGRFGEIDNKFLQLCFEKFRSFKDYGNFIISRMAYAPLFSVIVNDNIQATEFWQNLLKQTSYKGIPFQNIEYNFLLKKIVRLNDKDVEMNF
jgi:hypothetical protein